MDKLSAADAVRKIARLVEPMQEAARILEQVGSFEQAVEESKARLESAKKDLADAVAGRDRAKAEAARCVRDADVRAQSSAASAQTEAARIKAAAEAEAVKIVADAKAEAERVRQAGEERAAEVSAVLVKAQLERDVLEREAETLRATRDARKAELEELLGRLDLARAEAQKIIGRLT